MWQSGFALLVIIFAWLLVAEFIARSALGYFVPPPSVGADSFEFDTKVYYLEQSIRQRDPLDCLLVGDSMTNDGPDPKIIEEAYRTETGSSIHCFNFGMPAMFLDTSGSLAKALVNRFHPKLLILILSARDFESSDGLPFRHVASTDWAQQNLGKTSLRGWAVNSLYGYRYLLAFQYWLNPSNRIRFSEVWHAITYSGFTPLYGFGEPREIISPGPKFQRTYMPGQQGFDQILELKQNGVNVLIIDAPIRPDFLLAYHDNYFLPYKEYMHATLDAHDIPFWLTENLSASIPSAGWYDLQHVNEKGVPIMSTWLGQQLAKSYPSEFFK